MQSTPSRPSGQSHAMNACRKSATAGSLATVPCMRAAPLHTIYVSVTGLRSGAGTCRNASLPCREIFLLIPNLLASRPKSCNKVELHQFAGTLSWVQVLAGTGHWASMTQTMAKPGGSRPSKKRFAQGPQLKHLAGVFLSDPTPHLWDAPRGCPCTAHFPPTKHSGAEAAPLAVLDNGLPATVGHSPTGGWPLKL